VNIKMSRKERAYLTSYPKLSTARPGLNRYVLYAALTTGESCLELTHGMCSISASENPTNALASRCAFFN
jgi:hypothetical protein